jgi:hypothetical protein
MSARAVSFPNRCIMHTCVTSQSRNIHESGLHRGIHSHVGYHIRSVLHARFVPSTTYTAADIPQRRVMIPMLHPRGTRLGPKTRVGKTRPFSDWAGVSATAVCNVADRKMNSGKKLEWIRAEDLNDAATRVCQVR